jgi:predicted RNA methylase
MFNQDFYPTPEDVIEKMLDGIEIEGKIVLEPEAGKGDIVDYLNLYGAKQVLFCEMNDDLAHITNKKGMFLKSDFLTLESSQISHIDLIVMNPPFSADEKHILHAYEIAPAGCIIVALANLQTIENAFSKSRQQLKTIIDSYGSYENLGSCFEESERHTSVEIALIKIKKAGQSYSTEFEGFFLEDEEEPEGEGIMNYNIVRDLVNRYVESVKIFDRQLDEAYKMNQLTSGYFSVNIGVSFTNNQIPVQRETFKKEMQKSGWTFIFNKLNLNKYSTKGMKDDINKFVEENTQIPFTMKNIYVMLSAIMQTTGQRMDKAILEVFDKVTEHYHENRFNVEGWKTNSHYLLNQRFIMPYMCDSVSYGTKYENPYPNNSSNFEKMEDLTKAICYITGDNYSNFISLERFMQYRYKVKNSLGHYLNSSYYDFDVKIISKKLDPSFLKEKEKIYDSVIEDSQPEWGQWFEWGFFRCRAYKKGTMHFEFLDRELWGRFNQRVAKLKGYPLYEKAPDKRTERQKNKDAKQPRPTHEMKVKNKV